MAIENGDTVNNKSAYKNASSAWGRPLAPSRPEYMELNLCKNASAKVIENGDTVKVHYVGTLKDGTEFDSSRREGREPLEFTVGRGQLIPGFEKGVKGREVGDRFTVEIPCEEAYGPVNPELVFSVDRSHVPANIPAEIGTPIQLTNEQGQCIYAVISAVSDKEITLDANQPMAGKDLIFDIEILSVK